MRTQKLNNDSPCIFEANFKNAIIFEGLGQSILIVCCSPCLKRKTSNPNQGLAAETRVGFSGVHLGFLNHVMHEAVEEKV